VGLASQVVSGPSGILFLLLRSWVLPSLRSVLLMRPADFTGDSMISLQNTSGEPMTISKISFGDLINNSFNTVLYPGKSSLFSLSDLNLSCPCPEGQTQVTCCFYCYLHHLCGFAENRTGFFYCSMRGAGGAGYDAGDASGCDPANVSLVSPADNFSLTTTGVVSFSFMVSDDNAVKQCQVACQWYGC